MNAPLENGLFLLNPSSRAFLEGDSSSLRQQWANYRSPSQEIALGCQCLLGIAGFGLLLAWTSPQTHPLQLLTGAVGIVLLGAVALWAARDSRNRAAWQCLMREGQMLEGVVVECTGKVGSRVTEAEAVDWF